ncbi:MAG: tetratricopeptide repeat protein, partial [Planctomycetota bacterium]
MIARLGLSLALTAAVVAAEVEVAPVALDPLPPHMAPIALDPSAGAVERNTVSEEMQEVDRAALEADVHNLLRVRSRVIRRLRAGELPVEDIEGTMERLAAEGLLADIDIDTSGVSEAQAQGVPIESKHLDLRIQQYRGGARDLFGLDHAEVSANIRDEPVEVVYRELIALRGYRLDDRTVGGGRRRVALAVDGLAWGQALRRVLGQVGLDWRRGPDDKVVVFELQREPLDRDERLRRADAAFLDAAPDPSRPASAEGRFLRALQYHRSGDLVVAIAAYEDVFRDLDTSGPGYAAARPWVRSAMLGIAEAWNELGQSRDAYNVYMDYLSTAEEDDPQLPQIYLRAAAATRALGVNDDGAVVDPAALVQAEDLLDLLIQRFGKNPQHAVVVARARLDLGLLLYEQGAYLAAREHLAAHLKESAGQGSDAIRFMVA